jgi:hypothetical protein
LSELLDALAATSPASARALSGLDPSHGIRSGRLLAELLGEADEDFFGAADVAEAVHVSVLHHLAD